jgi:ribosomal protein L19
MFKIVKVSELSGTALDLAWELAQGVNQYQMAAFTNIKDFEDIPTPKVEAVRSFVSSRLGNEVEVHVEILEASRTNTNTFTAIL